MHKRHVFLIVILITVHLLIPIAGSQSAIDWHSYEDGLEEVKLHDKPVMIYFGAGWCSYCVMMKQDVFTDPQVIDASSDLVFIEVDTDIDPSIANSYGVTGLPTMIFLTPQGSEQFRRSGFRDVNEFIGDISLSLEMYHGKRVDWVSYEDGRNQAGRAETPLLLYFRDDSCTECDRMENEVLSQGSIVDISRDFVMVKIEAPSRPSLVQKYAVSSFPEIVITEHDGTELSRMQGFSESEHLYIEMESILEDSEDAEESTPGFNFLLLFLSVLISVLIYGKVIYTNK